MGDFAAASFGLTQAEITVADSVKGIVSVVRPPSSVQSLGLRCLCRFLLQIDGATREHTSGHFLVHTGEECPW